MKWPGSGTTKTEFLLLVCLAIASGQGTLGQERSAGPLAIAKQGFFYVGGHQVATPQGINVVDQMFVEYQIPAQIRSAYPLVMIHGNYQNGSNFLGTPDDREGWAEYFLRRGYPVYVVDQVARGRSPYDPSVDGAVAAATADIIERQFTAIERTLLWPQARLHTQWPGTGLRGDEVFEQFRASQNPSLTNNQAVDILNRAAGVALLKRIGPAVLLTHSRSGTFGWEIANDAPELVRGIVAVEPNGPPFYNVVPSVTGEPVFAKRWGIAFDQLAYEPPMDGNVQGVLKREPKPQGPDLMACWILDPPRKLPKLGRIPVMILTAEASYHAPYDHCTSQYLTRAGVANDFVRLESLGIHGNGHMMMLEKNNLQIAGVIAEWIEKKVKASPAK